MVTIDAFIYIKQPGSSKDWILSNFWDKFDDKLYVEVLRQKELKKRKQFLEEQEYTLLNKNNNHEKFISNNPINIGFNVL